MKWMMTLCFLFVSCAKTSTELNAVQEDTQQEAVDKMVLSAVFENATKIHDSLGEKGDFGVKNAVVRPIEVKNSHVVLGVSTYLGDIISESFLFDIEPFMLPHGALSYDVNVTNKRYTYQEGDMSASDNARHGVNALLHIPKFIEGFQYNANGQFLLSSFEVLEKSREVTTFTLKFRVINQADPMNNVQKVLYIDRILEDTNDPLASRSYKYIPLQGSASAINGN